MSEALAETVDDAGQAVPVGAVMATVGAVVSGVGNRDRERGRIGDVAGRIAGTSQQRVAGVRRRGRVPTHAVGSGGVLGAEQGAIQVELHAGNADVVRGVGGNGHNAGQSAGGSRYGNGGSGGVRCWKP